MKKSIFSVLALMVCLALPVFAAGIGFGGPAHVSCAMADGGCMACDGVVEDVAQPVPPLNYRLRMAAADGADLLTGFHDHVLAPDTSPDVPAATCCDKHRSATGSGWRWRLDRMGVWAPVVAGVGDSGGG